CPRRGHETMRPASVAPYAFQMNAKPDPRPLQYPAHFSSRPPGGSRHDFTIRRPRPRGAIALRKQLPCSIPSLEDPAVGFGYKFFSAPRPCGPRRIRLGLVSAREPVALGDYLVRAEAGGASRGPRYRQGISARPRDPVVNANEMIGLEGMGALLP